MSDSNNQQSHNQINNEFIAHIAHELKSPLNILFMYSETLQQKQTTSAEFTAKAATVIHNETRRMADMIDNLLNLSLMETGEVRLQCTQVDTRDMLRQVFDTAAATEPARQLHMHCEMPEKLGELLVDKELISLAVSNLLDNAIKYSDSGDSISMTVSEDQHAIQISIQDSGVGIKPEDQTRIYDKFFRSDDSQVRKRSGSGLGLSLVKQIIELHSGQIQLSSTASVGTCFSININKPDQTSALHH